MTRHTAPIKKKAELIGEIAIMAGFYGKGMRSYGLPAESVVDSEGTILVNHQLRILHNVFPKAIHTVIVKHNADSLIKKIAYPARIIENQNLASNEMDDLRTFLNATLSPSVMVVPGNLYFDEDMVAEIPTTSNIVVAGLDNRQHLGIVRNSSNLVERIDYGLSGLWLGFITMYQPEMSLVKKVATRNRANMFMYEGINRAIDKNANFHVHDTKRNYYRFESIGDVRSFDENSI